MADLLIPIIPPKISEKMFLHHKIFLDNCSDKELHSIYRFGRDSIEFLTEILENDLQQQTKRNHALSPTLQILVVLHFFVSSSFLQPIGDTVGLPNSSVSRMVKDVSLAVAQKQKKFILWPSPAELQVVKRGFYDKGGFPGVISCINGTHVREHKAKINESFMPTMSLPSRKIFHLGQGVGDGSHLLRSSKFLLFCFSFCFSFLSSRDSPTCLLLLQTVRFAFPTTFTSFVISSHIWYFYLLVMSFVNFERIISIFLRILSVMRDISLIEKFGFLFLSASVSTSITSFSAIFLSSTFFLHAK